MPRSATPLLLIILVLISCSSREKTAGQIPAFPAVEPAVKSQVAAFLTNYFALNQTLIDDDLPAAKIAASSFARTANDFNISALNPEQLDFYLVHSANLKSALQDLSNSPDIEKARGELAIVSESMYAMVKAFHPHESTLYYQYCPMARDNKGASWLSATKELVNPYMGQMMLACGRTEETIE